MNEKNYDQPTTAEVGDAFSNKALSNQRWSDDEIRNWSVDIKAVDYYLSIRPPVETAELTSESIAERSGLTRLGLEIYDRMNLTLVNSHSELMSLISNHQSVDQSFIDNYQQADNLYLFDVDPQTGEILDGVTYVLKSGCAGKTLAKVQEAMLGLAYFSLDNRQRQRVDQLLRKSRQNPPLDIRLNLEMSHHFQQIDPFRYPPLDEDYAFLGTYSSKIDIEELSNHYSNYFVDRHKNIAENHFLQHSKLSMPFLCSLADEWSQLRSEIAELADVQRSEADSRLKQLRGIAKNKRSIIEKILEDVEYVVDQTDGYQQIEPVNLLTNYSEHQDFWSSKN